MSYEQLKFGKPQRKRRGVYLQCETCKKKFYVPPSRVRQATKHSATIRYCSMKCYDKHGKKNPFYGKHHSEDSIRKMKAHPNRVKFGRGEKNPNFVRFAEGVFQGISKWWWLPHLRKTIKKCELCGWDKEINLLELHHKDRNRKNNKRDNLLLLCPTCHCLEHYNNGTGRYKWRKNYA